MARDRRTAFISGSGRNIGRAVALRLAADGLNVVINGSSNRDICEATAGEARALGVDALVVMGSVGEQAAVERMCAETIAHFGGVDVLVNNAAVRPSAGFLEVSPAEWQRVLDINFNGVFWLARGFLPGMVERGWGRLVNFTGMNAQQGYPGKPHVTVSKHAVWGLTKSLAKEFGPRGITSNIISPGTIVGEVADATTERRQALLATNPAGRLGTPADIAAMVGLLASDDGGFINGQLLQINGGVVG